MVAADELGIPYDKVRPIIGDTGSLIQLPHGRQPLGVLHSMAIVEAAKQIKAELCARACSNGSQAGPVGSGRRGAADRKPRQKAKPMTIAIHQGRRQDQRPHRLCTRINGAPARAWAFASGRPRLIETGRVTILRYTVAQDAGKALHPPIGVSSEPARCRDRLGLNGECVYGAGGKPERGLSRLPHARSSDVPMIDAILVEVANPKHPYGVRGVGETPIIPPLGAIANAMENATGIRFTELPMSPPKVLKALREREAAAKV
jgi:CO/xanthine dehydrogenase Mo-binding subunit